MKYESLSFTLQSKHNNKPFLSDARYVSSNVKKPLVLFVHGFKGFKDWGNFDLLSKSFAEEGTVFVKMNLSHNGTTPGQPLDFADLEAFGQNNYEIEMDDIDTLLDHITSPDFGVPSHEVDLDKICLMGHSRGGGICILKAVEDTRIKKLIAWAPVADFSSFWNESIIAEWKETGVYHIFNGRTKQQMPLYYQLIENYNKNLDRFSIPKNIKKLNIPGLIVHGEADEAVPVDDCDFLLQLQPNLQVEKIPEANHTFGGMHPYNDSVLPKHAEIAFRVSLKFVKS